MGTLRKGWLGLGVAAAFWGCGSEPGDGADASTDLRVLHHDAAGADATADAGGGDAGCTPSNVSIGLVDGKDPGKGCKFDVEWTCGDTQYRSGGGCDMAPDGGVLQGGCFAGGSSTSTFKTGATACPCDDPDAMGKLVRAQCLSQ